MNTRHLRPEDLAGRRWRGLVRESSQAQADKWSPERQREDLRRAGDELGMIRAEPLFYERTGSGEKEGAAELAQALADGKAGQYDVLVVLHTSRFARNRVEAGVMKREFSRAGIVIYFAVQRLISGTYVGGLTEGINEVIDEQDNETRRMWIAGGLRQRQASGRWVGTIPIGYRRALVDFADGTRGWDGRLELDPIFAPIVRRIYDEAAAGSGTRRIAHGLNADGIRTNRGRLWGERAAYGVLTGRAYTGRMIRYPRASSAAYYGFESADGRADLGVQFPAIIDETLWTQVQEGIGRRRSARGRAGERTYPLSGILRCAGCGYRMTGMNNRLTRYYRCVGRARFHVCSAPAIRADRAEDQFATWISGYHLPDDWRTEIARTSLERVKVDERDRRVNADERLKRLRDLYAWGDLTEDEYRRQSAEIRSTMAVVRPGLDGLVSAAEALRNLGPAWRSSPAEVQAAVPPLMLKSATVTDARISEWVVRAELRPLLDLCVPAGASLYSNRTEYIVRYSA